MALRQHVGRAFDSIDFILEMTMRAVRSAIEVEPERQDKTVCDMPDLLKDIYNSKMTRCEVQLNDGQASNGVDSNNTNSENDVSTVNDVTTSQMSPVPCTDDNERDVQPIIAFISTSDRSSVTDSYNMSSTTGSRDLESIEMAASLNFNFQDRRGTCPTLRDNLPPGVGGNISSCEVTVSDQRLFNISPKKPCSSNSDMQSEISTNEHEGEEAHALESHIVSALRNIGDNLDKNIGPKMKQTMWQRCLSHTIRDLKHSSLLEHVPKHTLKAASTFSLRVLAEYNRL